MGYLYGYYEPHRDVPLGIKAVVVAIYEPPQKNFKNSIQLLEDTKADTVDAVANLLGFRKVCIQNKWSFYNPINYLFPVIQ